MLYILIACIYISLLCWIWGHALIRFFMRIAGGGEKKTGGFCIECFAGLSVIAVISGLLSLFIPLGGILAQGVLLLPALLLVLQNKTRLAMLQSFTTLFTGYVLVTRLLCLGLFLLLLVLGASLMNHPDSIGYHIQTIKWIETYRAIPGLVHIKTQLGYQGLWYCLCAVFSFKFLQGPAITFINTTVMVWYVLFVINEINQRLPDNKHARPGNAAAAILYFLLLAFSCWSYVQVRLTATSVSPDFIAALYCWLIFYLLCNRLREKDALPLMLIFFLCGVAVTIKLSAFPICLAMVYAIYQLLLLQKRKVILFLMVCFLITLVPFIARNIITSGYIFFPSPFPDIVQADWKLSRVLTIAEKQYITSFARVQHGVKDDDDISMAHWLPVWWQLKSLADKLILSSLLILLLAALAAMRYIQKKADQPILFSLLLSVAALLFWFVQAPDPRFGFGFIIPVQGILIYLFAARFINQYKPVTRWLLSGIAVFSLIIFSYSLYRVKNYFTAQNLVVPAGAVKTSYRTINCGKLTIIIPVSGGCGDAPLPCSYNADCNHFSARGDTITDGFRGKK